MTTLLKVRLSGLLYSKRQSTHTLNNAEGWKDRKPTSNHSWITLGYIPLSAHSDERRKN